jgi:hypothetical protein
MYNFSWLHKVVEKCVKCWIEGQGKTEGLVMSLKRVQAATVSLIVYLRQNLQLQLAIDYITASTLLYLEKVIERKTNNTSKCTYKTLLRV